MGAKLVEHKVGQLTPCLVEYVELRKKFPELFEKVIVYAQPSTCVDEILYLWSVEDVRERFPYVLSLRDLLGCAFTVKSKIASRLMQQFLGWIGLGMTPVQHWTDTDGVFVCKRGATIERMC